MVTLPTLEAERDADCRVRVHVSLQVLPPEIERLVLLVAPHAAIAQTTLEPACELGRVVRDVPRAALAGTTPRATLYDDAFDVLLSASDAAPSDDVAVFVCGRDATGALHRAAQGWAREVSDCRNADDDRVATPSGDVSTYSVRTGGVVLARTPQGEVVEATVRSARPDRSAKAWIELQLDDGRTVGVRCDTRFVVTGRPTPVRADHLAVGDALVHADGTPVHVVATTRTGDRSEADLYDIGWPDTYLWADLVLADAGRAPSPPPPTPPPPFVAPVETTTIVAARMSYDCSLTATLTVGPLADDVRTVAVVAALQTTRMGARIPLDCTAGTVVDEVPRALVEALRDAAPIDDAHRVALTSRLSGGPITCDAPLALLPCARTASGALVALAPLARFGVAGSSCLPAGTLIDGPEGSTPIEGLAIGGTVYAWDPAQHAMTSARVERVVQRPDALVLRIELEDSHVLRVTPEHLVYDDDAGRFVRASALRVGDHVRFNTGRGPRVSAIQHEPGMVPVWDLHVGPPHTYFGDLALMHNY